MALLIDTPVPHTKGDCRFRVCRLISNLSGDNGNKEIDKFCRDTGVPSTARRGAVTHIGGRQIYAARLAGAREVSPQHMDQLIRSMSNE